MPSPTSQRLRDHTSIPFEVFIVVFTILPFFLLAYFYSSLPDRIPLFMHLNGEVAEWARKSVISVFRIPLLAVVMQIVCLVIKFGTIQATPVAPFEAGTEQAKLYEQSLYFNASLWDWFRWSIACKMSAQSVDTILLSLDLKSLSRSAFVVSATAALLGAVGALYYGYRLLVVSRKIKQEFGDSKVAKPVDERHVYARILYFNRADPALFLPKYIFNFANKWAWVLIACVIAYPLLVFWPNRL